MKLLVGMPLAAIVFVMSVVQANSSGCVPNPPVKRVEFAPGKACWYFQGIGTVFQVRLTAGQSVYVRMRGEENGRLEPSAHGPNNFIKIQDLDNDTDEIEFQAPTTGNYEITFSPCAAWGEEIKAEICAK